MFDGCCGPDHCHWLSFFLCCCCYFIALLPLIETSWSHLTMKSRIKFFVSTNSLQILILPPYILISWAPTFFYEDSINVKNTYWDLMAGLFGELLISLSPSLAALHHSWSCVITSSVSSPSLSSCLCSPRHLDNHSLWEGKTFAVRCFKIIMYSIQVSNTVPTNPLKTSSSPPFSSFSFPLLSPNGIQRHFVQFTQCHILSL